MRVFSVESDGGFTEYEQLPFETDHAEADLEQWLEANPDGILEDGPLLIIGRQVPTDLGKSIDLLGVDREGNVVVVELKRDRTPRDVVAQALEYAAFAAKLDAAALEGILGEYRPDGLSDLVDQHREYFDQAEAVAFNKDQRIVVVGQQVTSEIRQTAAFLNSKGIQVTCVEFSFFRDADGRRLLSQEIVVGREHAKPPRATTVTKEEFLKSCDDHGRGVFSNILDLAAREGMSLSWGVKGFSIGVDDMTGTRVVICFVYPPSTRYGQSIWTALGSGHYGIRKMGAPAEVVEQLWKRAKQTGLFVPAGRDLSCHVDRAFTDADVDALVAWCESVAQAIREHGRDLPAAIGAVTGTEPRGTTGRRRPSVFSSESEFMDACDEHGAAVFARIFDWARGKSLKINLGTAGCSVNVVVDESQCPYAVPTRYRARGTGSHYARIWAAITGASGKRGRPPRLSSGSGRAQNRRDCSHNRTAT